MDSIRASVDAFKKTALELGVRETTISEVDQISSFFVLLDTSFPSSRTVSKLSETLRKRLILFYETLLGPGLDVAAAIFDLLSTKLTHTSTKADGDALNAWGDVQRSIVSGVMDFLDSNSSDATRIAIFSAFGRLVCDVYLSSSGPAHVAHISTSLKCSVYGLLEEVSVSNAVARQLRDPQVLGSTRLGVTLLQTNDYLTFETLLNLFARLLPMSKDDSSGLAERSQYIQDVFASALPSHSALGEEVVKIMETICSTEWELTAMKIVEVFAKSRIAFSQPFKIDEIRTGSKVFSQAGPLDRLFVDLTSFLVNVDEPETGAYDALRVPFTTVLDINVSQAQDGIQHPILIKLSKPALLGDMPLTPDADDQTRLLSFRIRSEDLRRFLAVLRFRDMGPLITQGIRSDSNKFSLSSAPIVIDTTPNSDDGDYQTAKITTITSFMLDSSIDDVDQAHVQESLTAVAEQLAPGVTELGQAIAHISDQVLTAIQVGDSVGPLISEHTLLSQEPGAVAACAPAPEPAPSPQGCTGDSPSHSMPEPNNERARIKGLPRTRSQKQREAVFGASDDELSELSEDDSVVGLPGRPVKSSRRPMEPVDVTGAPRGRGLHTHVERQIPDSGNEKPAPRGKGSKKKKRYVLVSDSESDVVIVPAAAPEDPEPLAEFSKTRTRGEGLEPADVSLDLAEFLVDDPAPSPGHFFVNPLDLISSRVQIPIDATKAAPVDNCNDANANTKVQAVKFHIPSGADSSPQKQTARSHVNDSPVAGLGEPPEPPDTTLEAKTFAAEAKTASNSLAHEQGAEEGNPVVKSAAQTKPARAIRNPHARKRARKGSDKTDNTGHPQPEDPPSEPIGKPVAKRARKTKVARADPPTANRLKAAPSLRRTTRRKVDKAQTAVVPDDASSRANAVMTSVNLDAPSNSAVVVGTMESESPITYFPNDEPASPMLKSVQNKASGHSRDATVTEDHPHDVPDNSDTVAALTPPRRVRSNPLESQMQAKRQRMGAQYRAGFKGDDWQVSPISEYAERKLGRQSSVVITGFTPQVEKSRKAQGGPKVGGNASSLRIMQPLTVEPPAEGDNEDITIVQYQDLCIPTKHLDFFPHLSGRSPDKIEHIAGTHAERVPPPPHRSVLDPLPLSERPGETARDIIRRSGHGAILLGEKIALPSVKPFSPKKQESRSSATQKSIAAYKLAKIDIGVPSETVFDGALSPAQVESNDSIQDRILLALADINAVILRNMNRRVTVVMDNVRVARHTLLTDGEADLRNMWLKRVEHYNALLDLKSAYTKHHRTLVTSSEDGYKLGQEGLQRLKAIIQNHDRNSLSKKFSASLLPRKLASPFDKNYFPNDGDHARTFSMPELCG